MKNVLEKVINFFSWFNFGKKEQDKEKFDSPKSRWVRIKPPKKVKDFKEAITLARYSNDPIFKLIANELVTHGDINYWKRGFYGQGVRVAVLDTGIYLNSPFFKTATNIVGKSFCGEAWDIDGNGHGTSVASQIYHKFSLSEVVSGREIICCSCPQLEQLMILKVLNDAGQGLWDWAEAAIDYLLELPDNQRPHIINCSFSGHPDLVLTEQGRRIGGKLVKLRNRPTLIVAAAGNTGFTDDPRVRYFANLDPAIPALATDNLTDPAYFSSHGPRALRGYARDGVFRLGVDNVPEKAYVKLSGTSMASPDTAGFAALTLCYLNSLHTDKFANINLIENTWAQKGMLYDAGAPGADEYFGKGVLWFKDNINL